MNIVNQITVRQLRGNKKRTMVTVLGVIIASAMLTAVATAVSSFQDCMVQREIKQSGDWHLKAEEAPYGAAAALEEESGIKRLFFCRPLGYAYLEGSANADKPYLYVEAYDSTALSNRGIRLTDGRLPESEDELVIPSHVIQNGLVDLKVGDFLEVAAGSRTSGESELNQKNPFLPGEETVTAESEKRYRIVGIMERPDWEPYTAPGYTAVTFLDRAALTAEDRTEVFLSLSQVSQKQIQEAAERLAGLTENSVRETEENSDSWFDGRQYPGIVFHWSLLDAYGIMRQDGLKQTVRHMALILIAIIMIGSISLIHNAFAISLSERSRYLGMLSSVGATRKQKRQSVFYEGFIIGCIGIPLGILAGNLGMAVTFLAVNPMIKNLMGSDTGLRVVISWPAILAAILLGGLTIFISAWFPARRASKITPMDAIRQTEDIKLTRRTIRVSPLTRLLFGLEGQLALKNIKRHKKRYRSILFSLFISFVLFLSVASYSFYMKKAYSVSRSDQNYDAGVSGSRELYDEIAGWPEVSETGHVIRMDGLSLSGGSMKAYINQDYQNRLKENSSFRDFPHEEWEWKEWEKSWDETDFSVTLLALDDASFRKLAGQAGADLKALEDTEHPAAILLNHVKERTPEKMMETQSFSKPPENLSVTASRYDEEKEENIPAASLAFESVFLSEEEPMGLSPAGIYSAGIRLVISKSLYESFIRQYISAAGEAAEEGLDKEGMLYIRSEEPKKLSERLTALNLERSKTGTGFYVRDRYAENRDDRQLTTLIDIFAYGFITLMALICIANSFNGISTGIALRKRELAALKSIGMTPEAFRRMISFESLFYGLKALLYGLPAGFAVIFLIRRSLSGSFYMNYGLPWSSILAGIAAVFLVIGLSMWYSFSKIRKENIVDTLRDETI